MTFAAQIGLCLLGALFIIWLRAVISVKTSRQEKWDWSAFVFGNLPRFIIAIIGVVIVQTAMFYDAAGLQSTLEKFGTEIQLVSGGFALGSVVSAFVLIVPDMGKLVSILIISSMLMFTTGCPAKSDIEKAYNVSEGLSDTIDHAADAVGELFTIGVINYELKEKIVKRLRDARSGGKKFHAAVDAAYAIHKANLPDEVLAALDVLLSTEVVKPITDIPVDIGILSPADQVKVLATVAIVRQALRIILKPFIRARGQMSANYDFYIREKEQFEYAD